jgi:hypothetical protein
LRIDYENTEDYAGVLFDYKKPKLKKLNGIPETVKVYRDRVE